jgi:hypothetical protein
MRNAVLRISSMETNGICNLSQKRLKSPIAFFLVTSGGVADCIILVLILEKSAGFL